MALSIHLKTGIDFLQELPLENLNELADLVNQYAQEVERHSKK